MSVRPFWYPANETPRYPGLRESTSGETVQLLAPVALVEDFHQASLPSPWGTNDTGAATEGYVADAPNGVYALALTNANEAQLAGIDWDDHRPLVLNQCLAIEWRFRFTVLPTGSVVAVLGLCGDHNAAVNTVAESIWFRADGSGVITVETDDTSHETSQVATGVTLIADQWCIGRIECEDPSAVRFYLDGTRVASGTTFNMSQVAALALQPVARIGKESGATTVGTLQIDAAKIWQQRVAV